MTDQTTETTDTAASTQANNLTQQIAPDTVTEGSVRHNKELLSDLKKAQDRLAVYEKTEQAAKDAKLKEAGQFDELMATEKANHAKELAAREDRINALVTNNALNDMIGAYDVKPTLRAALISHLKGQLSVSDGEVTVGGKAPTEFAKSFFATDEGRDFLKPLINSGGGATGNTGTSPVTPDKWNMTTYAQYKAEDPALAAAYAKKHGKNY